MPYTWEGLTWQNPNLVNRDGSSDESSGELDESDDDEDDEGTDESESGDEDEETPKKVRAWIPFFYGAFTYVHMVGKKIYIWWFIQFYYVTPQTASTNCCWFLKAESNKKRPVESASKTHVPDKKAKFVTPQKTGEFLSPLWSVNSLVLFSDISIVYVIFLILDN